MNQIKYGTTDPEDSDNQVTFTASRFDKCLLRVLKSNPGVDSLAGLTVLATICERIVDLEPKVSSGIDRSAQNKTRTIYSQNTEVHNKLYSLEGSIESLIEAMGFTPLQLGNTSLKPNYVFRHQD